METSVRVSEKSYGVAVCLSGIFGVLGIHHFYLGRYLHGLVDLGMTLVAFVLYIYGVGAGQGSFVLIGGIIFAIDIIHTLWITILLLIGQYRDGNGLLVTYPGQRVTSP
ncbi:TM2 domain-containing protein [Aestuariispira ectoiniformans]|uniref:TM2 domain-containing protein n=1 Tax=Aestuariispira ectoiniformans TaxID=2775080 RepID=UPI00223B349F|nr:TM2 domain-containing protein [Aestuariispira ectoiniformans]